MLVLSAIAPLLFVQYDEPTAGLLAVKFLAKAGSLCGTVLLVWQLVLGFRVVSTLFHKDLLWLVRLHERVGMVAIPLILLHPIFITIYYAWTSRPAVWAVDPGVPFYWFVLLGLAALALLVFIFITSVFLRKRLGYGRWFATHLTTYAVLPLVFVHAMPIGMTLSQTPLKWYWVFLISVAAAVLLCRTLNLLGWRTLSHEVTQVRRLTPDVTELTMTPLETPVCPQIGQFVYLRRSKAGGQRPFSVAGYDERNGRIRIASQVETSFTEALEHLQPSETIYLDGPYGVFTQDALLTDRPLVMVAGGIGITAFLRLLEHLESQGHRPAWLFYGNRNTEDIAYRRKLDAMEHVQVVHVISKQPDFPGERGMITVELIRSYVHHPLRQCEVLLCGPPVMVQKLEQQLSQLGLPDEQIHHELFGF
ncbi:MAG: ferric reductase-like transmembrane domain-containing protein [Phycisphaerae bacterium]